MRITTDHLGSAYGQHDMLMTAMVDGVVAGSIAFSEYEGIPHVSMVEVSPEFRRRGVASAMMAELQERYPDKVIGLGTLVEDGPDFFSNLPMIVVDDPDREKAVAELGECRARIFLFEKIADEIRRTGDRDGELLRQIEEWNEVSDRAEELEVFIGRRRRHLRFVDVDAARSVYDESFAMGMVHNN